MKVLFVMPPFGAWSTYGVHRAPNQFYAQLAAYVREKGNADVAVVDARAWEMKVEQMLEEVKLHNPEVVVLGDILHSTGGLATIWHFNETARKIKEVLPSTRVAVGGLWYSALYEEVLKKQPYIDFVMVGEAELTLDELVQKLGSGEGRLSDIAGLASREGDRVVIGPHRELIPDIDVLPLPAYDLFPMERYVGHTSWKHFSELYTSRGCPGGCSFCYEWSQYDPRSPKDFTSWRGHSGKRVADELELLQKKFGVETVVFQDDAFNVSTELVEDICNEILRRNIKMNWVILGRADDWVKQIELFPLMKKAGMFMGLVGIEVSSDEELRKLGKGVTVSQIKETVDGLRRNNVGTVGTFMIGFEDDSEESIKKRFAFADEVDPDVFALQFVTPSPGSPLWKQLIQEGKIDLDTLDLRMWDFHHPVVPTKHLSLDELGEIGAWCQMEFFNRPERIERIMEGPYSPLVKLCVEDFMSNVANFEQAATEGKMYV